MRIVVYVFLALLHPFFSLAQEYSDFNISFQIPDNWTKSEDITKDKGRILAYSADNNLMMSLSMYNTPQDIEGLFDQAVETINFSSFEPEIMEELNNMDAIIAEGECEIDNTGYTGYLASFSSNENSSFVVMILCKDEKYEDLSNQVRTILDSFKPIENQNSDTESELYDDEDLGIDFDEG